MPVMDLIAPKPACLPPVLPANDPKTPITLAKVAIPPRVSLLTVNWLMACSASAITSCSRVLASLTKRPSSALNAASISGKAFSFLILAAVSLSCNRLSSPAKSTATLIPSSGVLMFFAFSKNGSIPPIWVFRSGLNFPGPKPMSISAIAIS